MEPDEIVIGPPTIYLAPVGTRYPTIDAAERTFDPAWVKVGTAGNLDYDDNGVTITHNQTVATFSGAGSTAPRKAYRTAEGLVIGFTLADTSPEQFALILDDIAVRTVAAAAGVAGSKSMGLLRGVQVHQYALLARGISSVDNTLNADYRVYTCYQSADPAPVYSKNGPAMLAVEFTALEVTAGVFVDVEIQTAPAS